MTVLAVRLSMDRAPQTVLYRKATIFIIFIRRRLVRASRCAVLLADCCFALGFSSFSSTSAARAAHGIPYEKRIFLPSASRWKRKRKRKREKSFSQPSIHTSDTKCCCSSLGEREARGKVLLSSPLMHESLRVFIFHKYK